MISLEERVQAYQEANQALDEVAAQWLERRAARAVTPEVDERLTEAIIEVHRAERRLRETQRRAGARAPKGEK